MSRTVSEIQEQIIASVQADPVLSGANSTSSTAIWRLWTRIVAGAVATLEQLFDLYRSELIAQVEAMRPHTLRWYQQKALNFQYGSSLPEGADEYDNTALTDDEVQDQKIIVQAAAVEQAGKVIVKVAKEVDDWLGPLASGEYDSFETYMQEIKDAGVVLEIVNQEGDKLQMEIDVYYDPLVLNSSGDRIDGTAVAVVEQAVLSYLRNLPFNGWLVKAHLVDSLQGVQGVFVPEVRTLNAGRYDAVDLSAVDIRYQPFAGYLKFDDPGDLVINHIAKTTL